jgi:hypothetical protein
VPRYTRAAFTVPFQLPADLLVVENVRTSITQKAIYSRLLLADKLRAICGA